MGKVVPRSLRKQGEMVWRNLRGDCEYGSPLPWLVRHDLSPHAIHQQDKSAFGTCRVVYMSYEGPHSANNDNRKLDVLRPLFNMVKI